MPDMPKGTEWPSVILDTIKWGWGIVASAVTWFAGRASIRRSRKAAMNRLLSNLEGLPGEAKAVLIQFYQDGTHTMRGDPLDPAVRLLTKLGFIHIGPGGGTYDAVDRYLIIPLPVWEGVKEWARRNNF